MDIFLYTCMTNDDVMRKYKMEYALYRTVTQLHIY